MPHNHGIRVMVGNDDHHMSKVYATQGVRLRERNRRRTEPMTWEELVRGWDALKQLERAASAPFVELNRRIADLTRPFTELSRQIEQSATGRVLAALHNCRAGLSGSGSRSMYRKIGN